MAEPNLPFYLASKEQLRAYASMSANSRRSPALKRAWEDREKLISRHQAGEWVSDLAKEYKVLPRAMYRILESDG